MAISPIHDPTLRVSPYFKTGFPASEVSYGVPISRFSFSGLSASVDFWPYRSLLFLDNIRSDAEEALFHSKRKQRETLFLVWMAFQAMSENLGDDFERAHFVRIVTAALQVNAVSNEFGNNLRTLYFAFARSDKTKEGEKFKNFPVKEKFKTEAERDAYVAEFIKPYEDYIQEVSALEDRGEGGVSISPQALQGALRMIDSRTANVVGRSARFG